MALTLATLRRHVYGRIDRESVNAALNAKIDDMVNVAIQEFIAAASWYFQRKTATISQVDGTKGYSLASDFDKMVDKGVRLGTTFKPIHFLNERDFDQVVTSPVTEGAAAEYYTLRGYKLIQLYPIPNSAAVTANGTVDYEYFATAAILAADATASPLPDKFDAVILHRAEELAQGYAGNEGKAGRAGQRWGQSLELAIQDNRQVVETGIRDVIRTQPEDQRQARGFDQRRRMV
jgi:hypothetical protein